MPFLTPLRLLAVTKIKFVLFVTVVGNKISIGVILQAKFLYFLNKFSTVSSLI